MLHKRLLSLFFPLLILIALPLVVHPAAVSAQATSDPCNPNLSQIIAGLVEAQAAMSSGNAQGALPVLRAAADALNTTADNCESSLAPSTPLPAITALPSPDVTPDTRGITSANVPGSFTAPNGAFVFDYPPTWSISNFITASDSSGAINIANNADALQVFATNPPVLASGQQAAQILGGSAAVISGGQIDTGTIDNLMSYFQGTLAQIATTVSTPEAFDSNGHPAGRITFDGENFEGEMIVVQLDNGARFVVIGGLAARGERDALVPTLEAIAASLQ